MPGLRRGEGHAVIDDLPAMQGETFRGDTAEEACGVKCRRCAISEAMMPAVYRTRIDSVLALLERRDNLPKSRELAVQFGVSQRSAQRWLQGFREAQRRPS